MFESHCSEFDVFRFDTGAHNYSGKNKNIIILAIKNPSIKEIIISNIFNHPLR